MNNFLLQLPLYKPNDTEASYKRRDYAAPIVSYHEFYCIHLATYAEKQNRKTNGSHPVVA